MAPNTQSDHDLVEKQIKSTLQDLFHLLIQVSSYDISSSHPTLPILQNTIQTLSLSLQSLHTSATLGEGEVADGRRGVTLPLIPPELVQYVDNGRNPDIYTREFVELARRGNQQLAGKMTAFGAFRDVLAGEMGKALPELREDIRRSVKLTGGDPGLVKEEEEEVKS